MKKIAQAVRKMLGFMEPCDQFDDVGSGKLPSVSKPFFAYEVMAVQYPPKTVCGVGDASGLVGTMSERVIFDKPITVLADESLVCVGGVWKVVPGTAVSETPNV